MTVTPMSTNRMIKKAAYNAGKALYGNDLVHRSATIKFRTVSNRVRFLLDNGCAPEVAMNIDTYEYAFTLEGEGIDCADEIVLQNRLVRGGHICLYHPDFGIDMLTVDCDMAELTAIVNSHEEV